MTGTFRLIDTFMKEVWGMGSCRTFLILGLASLDRLKASYRSICSGVSSLSTSLLSQAQSDLQ